MARSHQQYSAGAATAGNISLNQTSVEHEGLMVQMDYWLVAKNETAKKDLKFSLKSAFKSVQIFRPLVDNNNTGLSLIFATKDKKQKIMRLGKKTKDVESIKNQQIDNISRLICTSKSQNRLLTGWSPSLSNPCLHENRRRTTMLFIVVFP